MKKYLSLLEAAEELDISIHELQQHVIKGKLSLFAPNRYGKVTYKLYHYETIQFFDKPDDHIPLGCHLWDSFTCPMDCEHFIAGAPFVFCGIEADKKRNADNNFGPSPGYKLNELIVKRRHLEKLEILCTEDSIKSIQSIRKKSAKNQNKYDLELVEKLRRMGKENYEIIYQLKENSSLTNQKIFDILYPDERENFFYREKANKISDELKKDPNRTPPKKRGTKGR